MANIITDFKVLKLKAGFNKRIIAFGELILKNVAVYEKEIEVNEAIYYNGRFDLVVSNVLNMDLQFLPLLLRLNNLRNITDYDSRTIVKFFNQRDVIDYLDSNNSI